MTGVLVPAAIAVKFSTSTSGIAVGVVMPDTENISLSHPSEAEEYCVALDCVVVLVSVRSMFGGLGGRGMERKSLLLTLEEGNGSCGAGVRDGLD